MTSHSRIATALFSIALTLAACKGEGGGSDAKDWTTVPLQAQTVELGGAKLSWSVPEGLSRDPDLSNDTRVTLKSAGMGDPSASLKNGLGTKDLATAVNSTGFLFGSGGETLEQTERDGRFVVVMANAKHTKLMVAHYMESDAAKLECVVSQMTSDPIEKWDASIARFHEICDSVKVE